MLHAYKPTHTPNHPTTHTTNQPTHAHTQTPTHTQVMRTDTDKTHTMLYKSSNDLRRDQLILSCIDMMDKLLQKEGVDLRITTYKVPKP